MGTSEYLGKRLCWVNVHGRRDLPDNERRWIGELPSPGMTQQQRFLANMMNRLKVVHASVYDFEEMYITELMEMVEIQQAQCEREKKG